MIKIFLACSLSTLVAVPLLTPTPEDGDRAAVRQAANDYLDGIYLGLPDRIERSVDTKLAKVGFPKDAENGEFGAASRMTYAKLLRLAKDSDLDQWQGAHRRVDILDVLDKTASVRVKAQWGYDYMHLAKQGDTWKIVQILWQGFEHPSAPEISVDMLIAGEELFQQASCTRCHGDDGSGSGRGPNLADDEWIHCDGGIEGVRDVILAGVSKEDLVDDSLQFAMNAIGTRLEVTEEQSYALAAYVLTLSE